MKTTCRACHVSKANDEFYSHKSMPNGRYNRCKDCTRAYALLYRKRNTAPSVKRATPNGNLRSEPLRPRVETCGACYNQSWRRPTSGCTGCGGAFAPEQVSERETFAASSIVSDCRSLA